MRKLKTVAIVASIYVLALVMETVMAASSPDYQGGISVLVIGVALGIMATKVGYRWFDALIALIPIYGFFFLFKIAYRVAYLPQRDWTERASDSSKTN